MKVQQSYIWYPNSNNQTTISESCLMGVTRSKSIGLGRRFVGWWNVIANGVNVRMCVLFWRFYSPPRYPIVPFSLLHFAFVRAASWFSKYLRGLTLISETRFLASPLRKMRRLQQLHNPHRGSRSRFQSDMKILSAVMYQWSRPNLTPSNTKVAKEQLLRVGVFHEPKGIRAMARCVDIPSPHLNTKLAFPGAQKFVLTWFVLWRFNLHCRHHNRSSNLQGTVQLDLFCRIFQEPWKISMTEAAIGKHRC